MFGHSSGLNPKFDPKCSDLIRHRALFFPKFVRTRIWVPHLLSVVLTHLILTTTYFQLQVEGLILHVPSFTSKKIPKTVQSTQWNVCAKFEAVYKGKYMR
jgi:ABC-type polysaccharide transport system permease subunit